MKQAIGRMARFPREAEQISIYHLCALDTLEVNHLANMKDESLVECPSFRYDNTDDEMRGWECGSRLRYFWLSKNLNDLWHGPELKM